jgi:DNA-binding PadR family transcriptional regulator
VSLSGSVTAHVVLGLLASGARHGYEIKREHDERLPQAKPLAFGQVYATLARLARDGLVETAGEVKGGGPTATAYSLTGDGRLALERWLGDIEPPAPQATSMLLAKVVVALLVADGDRAQKFLVAQRHAHTARLRELTAAKLDPDASLGDVIAADFAIAHLDADLRWLQASLDRVSERKVAS